MSWDSTFGRSTFPKAHRRELYHRVGRAVRGDGGGELVPFEELRDRLRLFQQAYAGIRSIPVEKIVGTVARTKDFDKDFLPRGEHIKERWQQVERAFPDSDFPPIQVYKVGDVYFVNDGHHRVGIARQRGVEFIDAEITELHTRFAIPPDIDLGKIIHLEQERIFMEESGLARARPEAHIEFTRPHGYLELIDAVKVHGYHLMIEQDRVLPSEEIAGDWYDNVYLPAIATLHDLGLKEAVPASTAGDLFLWVHQRRREHLPEQRGISFEDAVRDAAAERGKKLGARTRRAVERVEERVGAAFEKVVHRDKSDSQESDPEEQR